MADKYPDLVVTVDGPVGMIKLNRPKQLNALSPTLIHSLITALSDLAENKDTIVTCVTGEGRYFSAGVDVTAGGGAIMKRQPEAEKNDALKLLGEVERFGWVDTIGRLLIRHPKPVIFALNGPVVGITAAWVGSARRYFGARKGKRC